MSSWKSVGRRLFVLVAIQTTIAFLLVLVAMRTISRIASDHEHMYDFQFQSVAAIGQAMAEAVTWKAYRGSAGLDDFYRRYRTEWETARGSTADAIHFREDLVKAGEGDMPQLETSILTDLERSMNAGNAEFIRRDLAALYDINVRYAALEHFYVMQRMQYGRIWIITIGITGTMLILFLGLSVRRAIAPRIRRLVAHVRDFRETGKYERIGDGGKDDIAVLANALDAGFSAIALRDREREQFLSIAAHELKTPVTAIRGYASLLVNHVPRSVDVERALHTINRQSWRLSRIIDALFLAMQARSGKLKFEPSPFDMSALVERVLAELQPIASRTFVSQVDKGISILGDEALLEHALMSLFACATTFSVKDVPLHVAFVAVGERPRLTVSFNSENASVMEIEELFMPFRFVEYETGSGLRAAIGLYLCREIVRLHNGVLRLEEHSERRPEFVMELSG